MHSKQPHYEQSPQYTNGSFHNNPKPAQRMGSNFGKVLWRFLTEDKPDAEPQQPIPVSPIDATELSTDRRNTVIYRLGHSSLLMTMAGQLLLVDPVFSERASPLPFVGPKRFHPVPITPDAIPPIDAIVISHDHYDHLDEASIRQ